MQQEENFDESVIRCEVRKSDGYEYKYELIMRISKMVASFNLPLYSVSVRMTKDGDAVTYAKTDDIFSDVRKAGKFFDRIVESLATPIDLPYVLEDCISL